MSGPGDEVPPAEQKRAAAKMAVARAYVDALERGDGTRAMRRLGDAYQRWYGAGSTPARLPARKVIPTRHYPQINNYFCGPATGKMILKATHQGRSDYNGVRQIQQRIGGRKHMRTIVHGATRWASGLFRKGMNRWRDGRKQGFYVDWDSPGPWQFRDAVLGDISNDEPFGADTVEFYSPRNDPSEHYNNHPNQTIGHWIVVHGYFENGYRVRFADPSTSVWPGVQPHFEYRTGKFARRFLRNNGITW